MKRNIIHYLFFPVLLLMILSSCKKFGDVNIDPTRSSNLDPVNQLLLTQLRFSGDVTINERTSVILTMPMVQHTSGAYYNRYGSTYIKNKPYMSELWEVGYPNDILNIVDAVNRTKGNPAKTNLNAMCRIMKVYIFARTTDLYGDIPYTEAGTAFSSSVVHPKFDSQKDIYTDFFKELKEASETLNAAKDAVPNEIYYQGDIGKWKRFANSLRLRLAMRLIKIDPDKAKAEVQAAFTAGVFADNTDICKTDHNNITSNYAEIRGNGVSVAINQYVDDGRPRVCTRLISEMQQTNDPRLQYIARAYWTNPDKPSDRLDVTSQVKELVGIIGVIPGHYNYDEFLGAINITYPGRGIISVPNGGQKVQLADFLVRSDAPFFHMTYAEVEFLLAEACVRWGLNLNGNASYHYEKGLEAACQQLALFPTGPTLTGTQIQDFKNDNHLAAGKELQAIDTQIWIALLMNAPEAYANWRRTGYPALVPGITAESTTTTIPRRFEYPLSEHEQNAANIAKAIAALGGTDDWTGRVWWDK